MYQVIKTNWNNPQSYIVGIYMSRAIAEYWQNTYNVLASISNANIGFGVKYVQS